jgi:hypothetical protein
LRSVLRKQHLLEVNPAEAAVASGLPIGLCTDALFVLADRYRARLRVLDDGVIRFGFPSLQDRVLTPWQQRAERVEAWWRKHNQLVLAMGTATLAAPIFMGISWNAFSVYDAVYQGVAIPLPLVVGACLAGGLSMAVSVTVAIYNAWGFAIGASIWGLMLGNPGPWLKLAGLAIIYHLLVLVGSRLRRPAAPGRAGKQLDPIALATAVRQAVRGTLFGPAAADELADERVLTAFLVKQRGIVTTGDLMGLMGWDADEVAEQLPRLLVDYGGELLVTEEGGLVCRFDALGHVPQASAPQPTALEADTRPFFERVGPPRLLDAPRGAVVAMLFLAAVGLAGLAVNPEMSWFPTAELWEEQTRDGGARSSMQGYGLYPYLLALTPIAVRIPRWLAGLWDYRTEAGFRALLRVAALEPAGRVVANVDTAALARLQGDIDVERGTWVHFPRLASAAATAARLRAGRPAAEAAIAYDTGAPPT